ELQVVCLKLWQSKDPDTLLSQRKIQGILEDFLSESLNTLSSDLRDPALALLRKMVTSSGTRNVISEEDLIQLVRTEDKFSPDHLRRALESLVEQTKLLRRERRQDVITYQIVSEFLVPWIKQQKAEQQARLLRRRAYRMILASLVVAAIMAAVAFGIWRFRTQQVLKDQTVQALEAKAALADNERAAALAERDR